MMSFTEKETETIKKQYALLKEHPCSVCSNEYCDICEEARAWLTNVIPFIFSPMLEKIIQKVTNKTEEEK